MKGEKIVRLRERIARFMQGRHGVDDLYYFFFFSSIFFTVISFFFRRFPVVYSVLYGLSGALLVMSICRALSRNIGKRRIENQRFLRLGDKMRGGYRLFCNRIRERKTHVYRRCKKCKAVLRLPRRKGRHSVKCPCCQDRFRVFIWFGKKK